MLRRLYVDNYKCLVNFEFQARPLQLLLGENGAGKSTVFEVLSLLKQFVTQGQTTASLFARPSLTRWQTRNTQTFELDVDGNGGRYRYRLEIEQDERPGVSRVALEELLFDDHRLFWISRGKGRLYRDDFSEGPEIGVDWTRSGVGCIDEGPDNQRLTWFRDRISHIYCLHLDPRRMMARTEAEDPQPAHDMSNFASWYRHMAQEKSEGVAEARRSLAEIIDGLDAINTTHEGLTVRTLKVTQRSDERQEPMVFDFDELSDGQRVLIALYTLLHCATDKDSTLCIDEPENFVALPEIQPWLTSVADRAEDDQCQVILASHHPELINYLARDCGVKLSRSGNGPTRVADFSVGSGSSLPDSELVARGLDDE